MSDILDYIRAKLTTRPLTPEAVESALSEARQTYGGDTVYVRQSRSRDPLSGTVTRNKVSRRTVQRWQKSI